MEEILTYLKESFEDEILSKSENKSLKEHIRNKKFSKHELDWLRSNIFKIAQEKVSGFENQQILNWIEKANKLILPQFDEEKHSENVFFSPGDDCLHAINYQLNAAVNSVDICVFTISDDRIANKILETHRRGVKVRVITDNDKTNDRGSDIYKLAQAGIPVKMDTTSYHMHHKFALIDKRVLITGSYNWTRSAAEHNQENVVVLDDKGITKKYVNKFNDLWESMVYF